jgi:hypothetical protein
MNGMRITDEVKRVVELLQEDECSVGRRLVAFLDSQIVARVLELDTSVSGRDPAMLDIRTLAEIRDCMNAFIVEPERKED